MIQKFSTVLKFTSEVSMQQNSIEILSKGKEKLKLIELKAFTLK